MKIEKIRLDCLKIASQYEKNCPHCLLAIADQLFNWCLTQEDEEVEHKEVQPEDN